MLHYVLVHFYFALVIAFLVYAIVGAVADEINHKRKDYR